LSCIQLDQLKINIKKKKTKNLFIFLLLRLNNKINRSINSLHDICSLTATNVSIRGFSWGWSKRKLNDKINFMHVNTNSSSSTLFSIKSKILFKNTQFDNWPKNNPRHNQRKLNNIYYNYAPEMVHLLKEDPLEDEVQKSPSILYSHLQLIKLYFFVNSTRSTKHCIAKIPFKLKNIFF